MGSETRKCQNCSGGFIIEPEDSAFYERIKVPPPTFCPECREQRRIAFRNERALYRRACDRCKKVVVSRISPDKQYPMYCKECWWGGDWDPIFYGRAYDFSKPFFQQFKELFWSVPHVSLLNSNMQNSEWVNQETDDKNCYLNVGGHFNEDSAYNTYELYGKDSFDNFWLIHGELCYENITCERCYRVVHSRECFDCRDTAFCFDCRNCMNCIGCAGLRNKQYHIFNKPFTKEAYELFLKENPFSSHRIVSVLEKKAMAVWLSTPHRERMTIKSVDVSGDAITESKNSHNIWTAEKMENCKHMFIAAGMKDSYDGSSIGWSELCYEGAHTVGVYGGKFFAFSLGANAEQRQSSYIEYCNTVITSNNCFGCMCLRNKEYCILNKQYTKEEYEELVPKIIEHMNVMPYADQKGRVYTYGEFFPIELSPYGYNETAAVDYYPLTRAEAFSRGYPWCDYESETTHADSGYTIPDDVREVKDDILDKVLICEASGRPYRIIPMELAFYRRLGLPIPRRSPLERHKVRMAKLLPRKMYKRSCDCAGARSKDEVYTNTAKHSHKETACPNQMQTPYAPGRPEVVYCVECYQAEIA